MKNWVISISSCTYESCNSEFAKTNTAMSKYAFEAEMYYNKAIDCYHNNTQRSNRKPKFYIKYGKLLQYQLKQYEMAESMYLEYITIDNRNSIVYFHYANLLQSMLRYDKANINYL
eukprot:462714_1